MGCAVEMLDNGQVVDVHRFDTKAAAENYLSFGRRYTFDRHEPWAFTAGIDLYQGPEPQQRAALRRKLHVAEGKTVTTWQVVFWEK